MSSPPGIRLTTSDVQLQPYVSNNDLARVAITINPQLATLRNGPLFDVTLEISGVQRFPAHKVILGLSSEYFRTLFTGRFKQSDTIVITNVESSILNLYLDLIYGKELVLIEWREALQLLIFAKFTQTSILAQTSILKRLTIRPPDFVEYVRELSLLYDNDIPLDVIKDITITSSYWNGTTYIPFIDVINFSDLGEEFTRALIETRPSDVIKYSIAQRAVKEGMSTELYGLVQLEKVRHVQIDSRAIPYLRKFDTSLLSTFEHIEQQQPATLLIDEYHDYYDIEHAQYLFLTCKTSDNKSIILALKVVPDKGVDDVDEDDYTVVSWDNTGRRVRELFDAVAIKVLKYHISTLLTEYASRFNIPGEFGPIVIDMYELLN